MNRELSKEEKQIRELAEHKNPYAKECFNRHLWNEGFIAGVNFVDDKIILIKEEK